ncbi:unnamed protein product [Cyprideis torosa]|uniref:Uncharacterized protein n=1 Tax=Cyprideis torosa TaxID=163714 RepID=A0A7R8WAB2_9CRUS|nr:unnamed protein product [Cyprideis torosa]CAG0888189.1 unnamed protein product [Cyprideis torosa]
MAATEKPLWYQYCVEFFTREIEALRTEFGSQCAEKALKTLLLALDKTEGALIKIEPIEEPFRSGDFNEDNSGAEEESETKPFQLLSLELTVDDSNSSFFDHSSDVPKDLIRKNLSESSGDDSGHDEDRSGKKSRSGRATKGKSIKKGLDNNNRRHPCKDCEADFPAKSSLYQHRLLKHRTSTKCPKCPRLIPAKNLSKHLEKHEIEPKSSCVECGGNFETKVALKRHITRNHRPENWITCDVCGKSIFKYLIDKHMMTHKANEGDQYPCTQCGKVYNTELRLYTHVAGIHKPAGLICTICGKGFRFKAKLREHEATHTGEVLFRCSMCNKGFSKRSQFLLHQRRHNDDRRFVCPHCSKAFFKSGQLKEHLHTHSGARPYACSFCGLTYSARGSVYTHIRIKHKNESQNVAGVPLALGPSSICLNPSQKNHGIALV